MTTPPDDPNDPTPERRHPHRFAPDEYRVPGQPVGFVLCVNDKGLCLSEAAVAEKLVATMGTAADDTTCHVVAWCVMPDHMHVVAYAGEGGDLMKFVALLRRRSSRALRDAGCSAPIWQRSYWDRHVRDSENLHVLIDYILNNPVREEMCEQADDWAYSGVEDWPDGW